MKEPLSLRVKVRPSYYAVVLLLSISIAIAGEKPGDLGDIPAQSTRTAKTTFVESVASEPHHPSPTLSFHARPHSRQRRAGFDGLRFRDIFRFMNEGAMEGVDSLLRSTRNYDVLRCIERFSCEMAAPLSDQNRPVSMETIETYSRAFRGAFVPSSDIQAAADDHEQVADAPVLGGQVQNPLLPPGLGPAQAFPGGSPFLPQPFPYYPQFYPPYAPYPLFPGFQGAAPVPPAHGTGHSAGGAEAMIAAPSKHTSSTMRASHMIHKHGAVKRNDDVPVYENDFSSRSIFAGYRQRIARGKRKYKNWWNNFRRKMGRKKRDVPSFSDMAKMLRRNKNGIMNSLKKLWNGRQLVGVLDRMMEGTDDSLYPYTRAALMGYTGNGNTCAELYPDCPTTMDEAIHTFNNLRRHFPEGIPFRDRIPAPFRYLIP